MCAILWMIIITCILAMGMKDIEDILDKREGK